MTNPGPIKVLDTILGSNFLAIQAAMKILERHSLDLSRYTILAVCEGESVLVVVTAHEGEEGTRKNFGVRVQKGAAMEMSARDLSALMSKLDQVTMLDKIQGSSLRAIRVAEGVFLSRNPNADLAQYKIEVVRDGDSVVVLFADKDRQPGTRGIVPGRPLGFEVELKADDFTVLRSYFGR